MVTAVVAVVAVAAVFALGQATAGAAPRANPAANPAANPPTIPNTNPAASAKQKQKQKRPGTLEQLPSLSRDDAYGPFAAALGPDGRGHLAFVSRTGPEAPGQLWYTVEKAFGSWIEPVLVLGKAPSAVAIAADSWGPAIGFVTDDGVYVATASTRHPTPTDAMAATPTAAAAAFGFGARRIAAATELPHGLALSPAGTDGIHAFVALDRPALAAAGTGSATDAGASIRRVAFVDGAPRETLDLPLDRSLGESNLVGLSAASLASGAHHMAILRRLPGVRLLALFGEERKDEGGASVLAYTRGAPALLPLAILPTTGPVRDFALTLLDGEPAIAWTADVGETSRLYYQHASTGRFVGPEVLLDTAEPIRSLALGSAGGQPIVAVATGKTTAGKLSIRWFEGVNWGPWQAPPGIERDSAYGVAAVGFLGGQDGRARVIVREVHLLLPDGASRLVEWTTLPHTMPSMRP